LIVLDASAAVCLLLDRPLDKANGIRRRLPGESLHAPHLIDLEVAQALRRLVLFGEFAEARASEALTDLAERRIHRHPHDPLLAHIWQMRANRTAYDAAYVALAEALGAPVITLDARMARTPAAVPIEVF